MKGHLKRDMERIDIFMIVVAAYVLVVTFAQLRTIYKFGTEITELYNRYSLQIETVYSSYRNSLAKMTEDFIGDAALARKDFLDGLVSDIDIPDSVELVCPDPSDFVDDGK